MKLKYVIAAGLCGAALVMFVRCRELSVPKAREQMVAYLEKRYPQDHFRFEHDESKGFKPEHKFDHEIAASCDRFPDASIHVKRWISNGKKYYSDNYMAYYLQIDAEACMHDIAESVFGECKVYMSSPLLIYTPDSFPTDASAVYFLQSKLQCGFAVYLPPSHSKENAAENLNKFKEKLTGNQFFGIGGGVRIIKEQDAYDEISSYDGPPGGIVDNPVCDFIGGFEV